MWEMVGKAWWGVLWSSSVYGYVVWVVRSEVSLVNWEVWDVNTSMRGTGSYDREKELCCGRSVEYVRECYGRCRGCSGGMWSVCCSAIVDMVQYWCAAMHVVLVGVADAV